MLRVISVVSGKGGVGKSTVSANIARSLARLSYKVLLVELDFGLRSLDIILGAEDSVVFDLGDVLGGADIASACAECDDGLFLLAAPAGEACREINFGDFLRRAHGSFDYVIFDCPAGLGETVKQSCNASDAVLLVTAAEPICVRDAAALARMLPDASDMKLIINRVPKKPQKKNPFADLDDVIDSVGVKLIGAVYEEQTIREFSVKGQKLPEDSPAYRAFNNIAERICGKYVPLIIK